MLQRLFTPFVFAYIFTVVLVNVGFSYVPMIPTPIGLVSPMAIIVGAVFVIRDFAQRRSGHYVLFAMLIATVLSYLMADPFIALASAAAFATSELVDYALYTLTKKPFHHRVLVSSLVSTPLDTAVFLLGIGGFTLGTFLLMVLSKLVAAVVIFVLYSVKEKRTPLTNDGVDWDVSDPVEPFQFRY